MEKLGLRITTDEIFPSSYAAAYYLERIHKLPRGSRVYVIGQEGIFEELRESGFDPIGGGVSDF